MLNWFTWYLEENKDLLTRYLRNHIYFVQNKFVHGNWTALWNLESHKRSKIRIIWLVFLHCLNRPSTFASFLAILNRNDYLYCNEQFFLTLITRYHARKLDVPLSLKQFQANNYPAIYFENCYSLYFVCVWYKFSDKEEFYSKKCISPQKTFDI